MRGRCRACSTEKGPVPDMTTRITGGSLRGRKLRSSRSAGLRPTSERVRGAIFSILGQQAVEGARVLDLYAGTGSIGVEALSRGAAWADFVESDSRRSQEIRELLREVGMADRGRVHGARVERVLDVLEGGYGYAFADPPYDLDPWDFLMERLGRGNLLTDGARVVVGHRHSRRLADEYRGLALVTARRYGDSAIAVYEARRANG